MLSLRLIGLSAAVLLMLVSHASASDHPRQLRHAIADHVYLLVANDESCPAELKRHDLSGQVRVFIRADGAVKDIVLDQRFGDPRLDTQAVNTFKTWRFAKGAGKYDVITIPVTFTVHNDLFRSNHALQPTASRREDFHMTGSTLKFVAQLAFISGG